MPLLLTPDDRVDNEEELIYLCHKLWLEGETDFDYTKVDNDESLDNEKIIDQDNSDKYFDDMEESNEVVNSVYTGIQDF